MFIACLLVLDVFFFNMILTREHKRHLLYYYFFFKLILQNFASKSFKLIYSQMDYIYCCQMK